MQPDHYVTRLLHANGVRLDDLGVGQGPLPEEQAREAWRLLCAHWDVFRGTPMRYWFDSELGDIFGVTSDRPRRRRRDLRPDQRAAGRADAFRPRALLERFGIEVLATTDDPADDLAAHEALAADADCPDRVIPTFRPDRYLEPAQPGWIDAVTAARRRGERRRRRLRRLHRRRWRSAAGTSSPTARPRPTTATSTPRRTAGAGARRNASTRSALSGQATAEEATAFRRHMVLEMARMSCDDGLVMTLHPGVRRNHHPATFARFGADTGHDIPVAVEFTNALQPLLERYGTHPNLHLVLFTLDADVFSREIAPLAGFYPSVYAGAPWWFLDNPSRDPLVPALGDRDRRL